VGNSASLVKIDDKIFTITHIDDSDHARGTEVTKGVKITTKETLDIAGNSINKFYTTRVAIVKKFNNEQLRKDVNNGKSIRACKMYL